MKIIFAALFSLFVVMVFSSFSEEGSTGSDQTTGDDQKHEMKQPTELTRETLIVEDKVKAGEHLQVNATLFKAGDIHMADAIPFGKVETAQHSHNGITVEIDDDGVAVEFQVIPLRAGN